MSFSFFLRAGWKIFGWRSPHPSACGCHLPPGEGLCWAWCNCRGPYHHQGSALKARKQGNCHPLAVSAAQANDTNGTRPPIIGNKGVLRTIGSKSTFAYFSLMRKVGRRRPNTRQYASGTDKTKKSPRQRKKEKNGPSRPEGQKVPPIRSWRMFTI